MITQIHGQAAEENDNDPVEVRRSQITGSALGYTLGYPPTSPIYYDFYQDGVAQHFWEYFPNGMIVWSVNTCAKVLYGPIFDFWAQTGQFKGPLGSPATDVTQLPDGTSFVVFENGVLWLDSQGTVQQLSPLAASMVQAFAHVDPSITGITALAQQKISDLANQAVQSNQQLKDNVNSITPTVQFDHAGNGGCTGASFNNPGTSLARSHTFNVHLDISLKGCAGTFGGASADMHVTIRLHVTPPNVQAFLESYTIDQVGSPFGAGDNDIRNGLTSALNAEYGHDLLGVNIPSGITLLAGLVDTAGNVNLFMEPLCTPTTLMSSSPQSNTQGSLAQIRRLRDEQLLQTLDGQDFAQVVEVFGPVLLHAIRSQPDGERLSEAITQFLLANFHDQADVQQIALEVAFPANHLVKLRAVVSRKRAPELIDPLLARAIAFIRTHLTAKANFSAVMVSLAEQLDEAIKYAETFEDYPGPLVETRARQSGK